MSEKTGFNSFHQTFECIHFDSTACDSRLFPVPPHRHYFSEVMLVRSGAARVVRGSTELILQAGELIYISPLIQHSVDSADGKPLVFDVVKFSATRSYQSFVLINQSPTRYFGFEGLKNTTL